MTAARVTCGAISLSSCSHFPAMPNSYSVNPVTLAPGRARLSTNPCPTGSGTKTNTIGMVRVAAWIGPTASLPSARITSDGSAANSAAYLRVSLRVVDHRTSMRALRPSVQPSACRACANTTMRACASGSLAAIVIRMPIRRFLSACCPRAASGHAAAAPPSSVMNSRRLMSDMGSSSRSGDGPYGQSTTHLAGRGLGGGSLGNTGNVLNWTRGERPLRRVAVVKGARTGWGAGWANPWRLPGDQLGSGRVNDLTQQSARRAMLLLSADLQPGATSMGHLGRTQKSQAASEKKLKAYACELEQKLEARTRELAESRGHLSEALERQIATSEVLQVISSSPGNLQPVFEAMLANAVRLCGAKFGTLNLYDGEAYRNVALHNVPAAYAKSGRGAVIRPAPGGPLGRVARTS